MPWMFHVKHPRRESRFRTGGASWVPRRAGQSGPDTASHIPWSSTRTCCGSPRLDPIPAGRARLRASVQHPRCQAAQKRPSRPPGWQEWGCTLGGDTWCPERAGHHAVERSSQGCLMAEGLRSAMEHGESIGEMTPLDCAAQEVTPPLTGVDQGEPTVRPTGRPAPGRAGLLPIPGRGTDPNRGLVLARMPAQSQRHARGDARLAQVRGIRVGVPLRGPRRPVR